MLRSTTHSPHEYRRTIHHDRTAEPMPQGHERPVLVSDIPPDNYLVAMNAIEQGAAPHLDQAEVKEYFAKQCRGFHGTVTRLADGHAGTVFVGTECVQYAELTGIPGITSLEDFKSFAEIQ